MVKVLAILYSGGKAAEEESKLLGTVENRLGFADWLKKEGHEFIVTADKEGPDSEFQKHLPDVSITLWLTWQDLICHPCRRRFSSPPLSTLAT